MNFSHGHAIGKKRSPTYVAWWSMMGRCYHAQADSYRLYGARGVRVCEKWMKFKNFLEDMGEKPEGMTLDRIDSKKNYGPENCRWVSWKAQNRNRSITRFVKFKGKEIPLGEAVEKYGVRPYRNTWDCIFRYGWTVEDALLRPKRIKDGKA